MNVRRFSSNTNFKYGLRVFQERIIYHNVSVSKNRFRHRPVTRGNRFFRNFVFQRLRTYPYLNKTLTITADNGKEFTGYEKIKGRLKADEYFAHLYHSWEHELNENTNSLIKQHFTKGSSFENITDDEVGVIIHKLNHRPRKTLSYKTPYAVFFAEPRQEAP